MLISVSNMGLPIKKMGRAWRVVGGYGDASLRLAAMPPNVVLTHGAKVESCLRGLAEPGQRYWRSAYLFRSSGTGFLS